MKALAEAKGSPSSGSALYRSIMGRVAVGISVILSGSPSAPTGMTVNSLVSVSLDPLLLLFCARLQSVTARTVIETGAFSVNILTDKQQPASKYFAGSCSGAPDFETCSERNHIWIKETVGSLLCLLESVHRAGDHNIIIGRVREIIDNPARPLPLIYHEGRYRSLEPMGIRSDHTGFAVPASRSAERV